MRYTILLLLTLSAIVPQLSHAATVEVPDKNLAAQIRKELKIANADPITSDKLLALTKLKYDARNKNMVTNLEGLEHATNLYELNLNRNNLSDLTPLSNLTKLRILDIGGNKNITDYSPVVNTGITRLTAYDNGIQDLSSIVQIPTISTLTISSNPITDLSPLLELKDVLLTLNISSISTLNSLEPLGDMTRLRSINMSNLPDMDLSPLSRSTSIRSISATKARFSDLSPLGALTDVTYINFESSYMTTLDGLETLSKVTQARLRRGSLVDVSALGGMTALQTLDLEDNNVVDISSLTELEELVTVELHNNRITDISPMANKEKLVTLIANKNNINSVAGLTNLPALKTLDLDFNNIPTLDEFDAFPSLVTLQMSANDLTNITAIDKLPALKNLYVSKNQIEDLTPATQIPALVTLAASENLISTLPSFTGVPDLVTLDINKNQVSDLTPVSVASNLVNLYADYNEVDTLGDWSQLSNLEKVLLRFNQITDFSTLGNCSKLKYVYINNNPATTLGDWTQLTILEDLDAWSCEFEDVSGLSNSPKLKEANLHYNQISILGDWSKLKALSTLRLDRNRLRDVSSLKDCTSLITLYLHHNQINKIGDFSKLQSLQTLILNENLLNDEAVTSISACTALKDLRLAHNQLVGIGFTDGLSNLVRLDLNNNLIQGEVTFPDSFSKLQDLYLHYNQITSLSNTEAIQQIKDRGDELKLDVNFLDGSDGSPLDMLYNRLREIVDNSNPALTGQTNQLFITVDYDGDGLPSDWEIANKTNAHRANANADLDGDLYTNLEEYQNQTNPNDGESFPTFAPTKIVLTGNVAEENQVSVVIGKLYAHDKDSAAGFEVIPGELSWSEAKAAAEASGGHLATINTPFEERLLFATTPEELKNNQYWIGATNTDTEGLWTQWITGEPMLYFPWGDGEPNGGQQEPYLELSLNGSFQFDRYPFNVPSYFPGNHKNADNFIPGTLESVAYQTYNQENHFIDQNLGLFTTNPTGTPVHISQTLNIRSASTYQAINENLAFRNLITGQFRGYFYADEAGIYEFGNLEIQGYVGFWIDFDQDGVFEHKGAKGYESVVSNWTTGTRSVHLDVGYYPVVIQHSTHIGSMVMNPFFKVPGGERTTIHPAQQPEHWFALPEINGANATPRLAWNDEFEPSRQGYILEKSPLFELVAGRGSTHNQFFEIRNSELILKDAMDFETTPVLSVRVRVTDRHDLTHEQEFQVSLTDVNEPSTAVTLSSTGTPEDRPAGSLVGIIITEDPDENDEFTYALVDGEGATDNAAFVVEDNQLRTTIVVDRDVQVFYSIRLKSTDSAGHTVESIVVIEALDMPENQTPNDITISTTNVPENQPDGTPIAVLTGHDADGKIFVGGIGTYSLVNLRSATFNKAKVHAGKLGGHLAVITSKAEWDIAVKQVGKENLAGLNILLGATDEEKEGRWRWVTEEAFAYERWADGQPDNFSAVHNAEEHHLAIQAESGEALEWSDINAELGRVDYYLLEQPMTYELVEGKGSTHNEFYKLLGNRLLSKKPADFEEQSRHSIRVRITDNGGLSYEKIILLDIQDGPDAPLGITINRNVIAENLPIRSEVGKLTIIDPDQDEKPIFTLLTDTPYFYIQRDSLLTSQVLNFESIASHTLEIEAKDKHGLTVTQEISIDVSDTNDLPTSFTLSTFDVPENLPANSEVATLSATDPDANDTHRFLVVGGPDKSYFRTRNDILTTTKPIDFEATPTLSIVIQVTDSKKGALELPVTLNVIDTNDAPTAIQLSSLNFLENLAEGDLVAKLTATDQDPSFQIINESKTWQDASDDAETRGGHLATFESSNEWIEMVNGQGGIASLMDLNLWLGASDAEEEGEWSWIDGTELTYARWANPKYLPDLGIDPPDNLEEQEHYMAISAATGKRVEWDDMDGALELDGYLLEIPHTYELVEGKGDNDNGFFQIAGDLLQMRTPADFETRTKFSIRLRATDPGGLSYEKSFQLLVTDAPDRPTDIKLSTHNIPENQPKGFHAATLTAEDPDAAEKFVYSLVGSDTNDNDFFYLVKDRLHTNQTFNFEEKSDYLIKIQVKDKDGGLYSEELEITITDANDVPTAISIDEQYIEENLPKGTVIGKLSAEDPDPLEKHTFAIVGGKDKANVYFKRETLYANEPFDFETKSSLDLVIRVTDKAKAAAEFPLKIYITDVNDAPTDILLSKNIVAENAEADTIIGDLTLLDVDPGYTSPEVNDPKFPFVHVDMIGDTHVDQVSTVDVEGLPTGRYMIRLAKDSTYMAWNKWPEGSPTEVGWSNEFWYIIDQSDLISHQVDQYYPTPEEAFARSIPLMLDIRAGQVLKFLFNDGFPDGNRGGLSLDIFPPSAFELVEGVGDTDNALFKIEGSKLKVAGAINFEAKPAYSIRVKGYDVGGLTFEKVLSITSTDQPDAPTGISLSNNAFVETTKGNFTIGLLNVADEDAREYLTAALIDHPEEETDNALFQILKGRNGPSIATSPDATFDFEVKPFFTVYVQVTDKDGLTYEQWLTLELTNINEAPTDLDLSNSTILENQPSGSEVGTISVVDPDVPEVLPIFDDAAKSVAYSDSHSYLLVSGEGDDDNNDFKLDKTTGLLTTIKAFDYETQKPRSIRVKATDAGGFFVEKTFTISIINGNDAPEKLVMNPATLVMEEQQDAGTVIASFSITDVDLEDTEFDEAIHYTLSAGDGDTHNSSLEIIGNELIIRTPIVHEATPNLSFRVSATDKAGESFAQVFSAEILNRNDKPTSISIDNNAVQENQPFGAAVGTLSAKDPDVDDTHTFKLVSGQGDSGNSSFFIKNSNQLVTNGKLDFEIQNAYSIRVKATDAAGATLEQVLSISVTDEVDEVERFELSVIRLPDEGGLTSGAGLHVADSIAELSAIAGPGYTFAGWGGDLPDGSDTGDMALDVLMNSDKTLRAYFARRFHSVEVSVYPDRHGYAKGGGSILYGAEITLIAEELEGDDNVPFSHWRINGVDQTASTDLSLTLTVEGDMKVEAVFDLGLPENFVLIPAGTYTRDPEGRYEHTATVSAFYTSTHETSKAEWYEVYNWAIKNGYEFDFDPLGPNGRNRAHTDRTYDDDFPITGITWNDMIKWCNARSEKQGWTPLYYTDGTLETPRRTGSILSDKESPTAAQVIWRDRGFRLPSELEWERAARGGQEGLDYPNGNTIDETQAFFGQRTNIREIDVTTGSSRTPNGYGLYDMVGNAWEACWDWYSKTWYLQPGAQEEDTTGPAMEATGLKRNLRTARGGSGNSAAKQLTVGGRLALKTWGQYAITLRPVFPAPTEPDATITLSTEQAHLGNVKGAGVYQIGTQATLTATPENGAAFVAWQDADGNVLGESLTLDHTAESDITIYAVFEDTSGNPSLFTLLTFAEPAGNGTVSGTGAYLAGSTVQITATPADGLDFAGWSGDAFGTETTIGVTVNQSTRVTGAFGDTSQDSDKDGLSDLYEKVVGSNPFESDSDGDKLRDGDEVSIYGSDPTKADTDGDGHDDRTEYLHDTNLNDPNDFPFFPLNDLVRYFTFRSKPYDYSGNRGHGTAKDIGIVADRWEVNKSAFSFNGTTSFVEVTGYNGATDASARALCGWVRVEAGNTGPLLSYGNTPTSFEIRINESGLLEVISGSITLTGTSTLTDEDWHHFVVTLPEGGIVDEILVYIDGNLENTSTNGDSNTEVSSASNSPVLIAKNSSNEFFTGELDDIRLYARALAASESASLYDLEVPKEPDVIRPTIIDSPVSQTVAIGETATFVVNAKAKPTPTYKWEKQVGRSWAVIKGENTNTLTIADAQQEDAHNYRVTMENSEGIVSSRPARLDVKIVPYIEEAPEDTALLVNRGGRIYAHVGGSARLTYEWFKDGESLGIGGSSYYIPKTANQAQHGGNYSFKVTNDVGEVSSEEFAVSIVEAVVITEDPVSAGVLQGNSANLSVTATGGGPVTYQWQKYNASTRKYEDIEGATESTYAIDSMTSDDVGFYLCVVDNKASSAISMRATLEMYIPPSFSTQPVSTTITASGNVTLASQASGDPAPSYIWQKFNTETDKWEDQVKYTGADLVLKNVSQSFAGKYRVKATNVGGSVISEEVDLEIYYKPVITTDLESLSVNEHSDLTLTVEGDALDRNGSDVKYAWFHNKKGISDGLNISGSTTNSLTITSIDPDDYGTWYCILGNAIGETQSRAIKVTVIEKPTTITPLANQVLEEGNHLLLAVSINGTKPITYQWYKDDKAIVGATLNKLYLKNLSTTDSGEYKFEAVNAAGTLTLTSNVTVAASAKGRVEFVTREEADNPEEDSDGDGLVNLLEQALGSDPANPNSTFSPTLEIVEDGKGKKFLSYSYTLSQESVGLNTVIELSTDLHSWEPLDLSQISIQQMDRGDLLQTTVYLPIGEDQKFVRIRVEE